MEKKSNSLVLGMSVISSIFFIFGFATTFIITLSSKVKDIFTLSEASAQLLTGAFFLTYLVLSIPSGYVIRKIGYKTALITGLLLMAVGAFMFYPAAKVPSFPLFLAATFVLAAGVVFLQTSANPYVVALGSSDTASGRLNLTQALNSIATMIAPYIISVFIFKGVSEMMTPQESAQTVQMPFVLMGVIVLLVAFAILLIKLPKITGSVEQSRKSVWKYPHVLLGAVAIFNSTNLALFFTPVQLITLALVNIIYLPCLATVTVLAQDYGWKTASIIAIANFVTATLVGGIAFRLLSLIL